MAFITHASICDSIVSFLSAAPSLNRAQSFDELTEGMNTTPTLQVYPQTWDVDDRSGVHQTTFRGGVKRSSNVYFADIYARQRSDLKTDITEQVGLMDEFDQLIQEQTSKPYFGNDNIAAYHVSGERVTFTYAEVQYVGIRYTIEVWLI